MGPVIYAFHPSPAPLLYRDLLIVLPLYFAFLLNEPQDWVDRLPQPLLWLVAAFSALIVAQMANPNIYHPLVALIGAKVWLFYLPLTAIGYAYARSRAELIDFLRLFAVVAIFPCLFGIAMWASSTLFGYYRTMTFVYGIPAAEATQDFAWFWLGAFLYRIPSTFQFPSQYFGFALFAIAPIYMLLRLDTDRRWRRFAGVALGVVIIATFLMGARGAFVFVPLLLLLILAVSRRIGGAIKWGLMVAALMAVALFVSRIDPLALLRQVSGLVAAYGAETAWGGMVAAFARGGWFGIGTGMNAGASRYALINYTPVQIENWYARAFVELGAPGLVLLVAIVAAAIYYGYRAYEQIRDPAAHRAAAAMVAYLIVMALNSLKGWQMDLDPTNFYYWLFLGILLRLPSLDEPADPGRASRSAGSGST
ncbi:MAG: hypothetical protein HY057_03000, partial [Rhodospirillales bacterium]|nr:hypothetical protein [Rhodospirillales bacterium]